MMGYYLFLDDIRFPKDVKWIDIPSQNWQIVRSYDEFINFIEKNGIPYFISFDHDLSSEHYSNSETDELEKTGFHAAKWLIEYCIENNLEIPEYAVHSMNPIGKQNIISIMEQGKRFQSK